MRQYLDEVGADTLTVMDAGSGETLVFLHGAGGPRWTPMLELLGQSFHLLAPCHPGFAHAPLPDWLQGVDDLAFFYLDWMKERGLQGVHLVGHSLGGWLAAEIAIRSTQRLASLSLLAPAGVAVAGAPFGEILNWSGEDYARATYVREDLIAARIASLPNLDPKIETANRKSVRRIAGQPFLHNPKLPHWLHRIDLPTLLVWGDQDRIIPTACAEVFQREIEHARLVLMAQSGHGLHTERPAETSRAIIEFIRGLTSV